MKLIQLLQKYVKTEQDDLRGIFLLFILEIFMMSNGIFLYIHFH